MNKLDKQYQKILEDILEFGTDKSDRTGTGTRSLFGHMIYHNMSEGFPLLTTKKMPFKTIAVELMWFLKGDTNIKYLVDNKCNIWNGDAYKRYETYAMDNSYGVDVLLMDEFIEQIKNDNEFAKKWGELGPIYGKQWRDWTEYYTKKFNGGNPIIVERTADQIENLINGLKNNPDSRRHIVSAWNVGDINDMTLPPCHYGFQVYTRELSIEERYHIWFTNNYETGMERCFDPNNIPDFDDEYYTPTPKRAISLMWNQRSVDTFLGLPFNIASYGLLLTMLAKEVNMIPDKLIGSFGDTHLYLNHIDQAKELISREPKCLPELALSSNHNFRAALKNKPEEIEYSDFILMGYDPHPTIKAPLSN